MVGSMGRVGAAGDNAAMVAAMSEPDPARRFAGPVAMREAVTLMGDVELDDTLRARLVALSVFLEEYRHR
jgi:hypothetical protein